MGDGPVAWASQEQVARICPLFPKERGVKRVEDRKVLSGVIACHSEGAALGGCPGRRWPPQNPLQPFSPLVRQGCFLV